ncbi:MAG: beta-galactosidase [Planctomycetota bacterium]
MHTQPQPAATLPTTPLPGEPHTGLVDPLVLLGYQPIARLRPRHAREITGSPWSIGCETCDRDYVDFDQAGPYLGELGAKSVRLQAGWAKCDPGDGTYQWDWLDTIVDSALAQGVRPWLETSYGNPAYPGGGGIGLAQGLPHSDQALAAWYRWVAALVQRYGNRIDTWEVWNEPDNHAEGDTENENPAEAYTEFFVRTARTVRQHQPHAVMVGLALAGAHGYAESFVQGLADRNATDLLSELCYHFYPHNPDRQFERVEGFAQLLQELAPHVRLRQGETGAPAETQRFMAMGQYEWSPRKQAVWNLRRMLAHHARGIPMNLFQLADMRYEGRDGALHTGYNPKGQLRIREDLTVESKRPSFFMAQHVFGLLDDAYPLRALDPLPVGSDAESCAYAWTRKGQDTPSLIAWWQCDRAPGLEDSPLGVAQLDTPMLNRAALVDLLSGTVFEPPANASDLPITDVPLMLADRDVLHTQPLTNPGQP